MSDTWKRCGHPRTPENTSAKQCRTCKRVTDANRHRSPRPVYEKCDDGFFRAFSLDQDGFSREDRGHRDNIVQGSRRLAKALQQALAA